MYSAASIPSAPYWSHLRVKIKAPKNSYIWNKKVYFENELTLMYFQSMNLWEGILIVLKLFLLGFLFLFTFDSRATDFPLVPNLSDIKEETLSESNFEDVIGALHNLKAAPHLSCGLKVRHIKELRKFSTGERLVEMIEVSYSNNQDYGGIEMNTYFPMGSKLKRALANSEFSGTVEEIKIESADRLDHWLTVQHDGRSHLIWAEMGNVYHVNPCQLK